MLLAFFAIALMGAVVGVARWATPPAVEIPPVPTPLEAARASVAASVAAAEVAVAEAVAAYTRAKPGAARKAAGGRLNAALRNLDEVRRAAGELDHI